MTCGTFFVWHFRLPISKMEPANKKQKTEGLAKMQPSYTPLEQYLFLEIGALNQRIANIEEESTQRLERISVLEDVVWKLLRNNGSYVREVTEAVLEQAEADDDSMVITDILAAWNAEQDQAQQEWLELFDEWFDGDILPE